MSALTYGLSNRDLLFAKRKIEKQKNYLESNKITGEEGVIKSFLDVSYSANLSQRYYPRILNKVDTFVSTSLNQGLVPIFLTVTADGFFRDMLKGDYSRWTEKTKEKYERHIPNNDRSGHYYDYMNNHNVLTPKDVYKIIGHQLHSFYKCETLRRIKKDGFTYTSIRVTEPHKDGVPHFHILMYVPEQYIPRMYIEFQRFFPAPRNHKKLTYKNTQGANKRNGSKIGENMHETFGFQTEVRSAAGYILKYILKSFRNLIDGEELDFYKLGTFTIKYLVSSQRIH
ncbi:MAG: replication endonuclease [Sulfurovum sp.]|nr:replication endonuclease [Sulfurovum sp.]